MGHLLGYARVSTADQHPQLQVDALQRAGCYRVFTETASGARSDRPVLEQVLDQLRPGDTLVVWKLDRLGRSLRHLVDTVTGLAERGIGFRSLQEAIDNTTTTLGVSRASIYRHLFSPAANQSEHGPNLLFTRQFLYPCGDAVQA
jgi:DNA invertase Pin-like site-specific DNA recombinase